MNGSAQGQWSFAPSSAAAACAGQGTPRTVAIKVLPQRPWDLMLRSVAAPTEQTRFHGFGCAAMRLEA